MMIKNVKGLSGNALKCIAMITMAIDHIGFVLLPSYSLLRIIGRLAFPIFAYLIAEGCRYTKNKTRHFQEIFGLGVVCQLGYALVAPTLYFGVLLTFSISIVLIYSIQLAQKDGKYCLLPVLGVVAAWLLCNALPNISFDYGFAGVMLPVLISLSNRRTVRLVLAAAGICFVCIQLGGLQWWSLSAMLPLSLYSGQRGRKSFKYSFYLFYPAHLLVIYGLGWLLAK